MNTTPPVVSCLTISAYRYDKPSPRYHPGRTMTYSNTHPAPTAVVRDFKPQHTKTSNSEVEEVQELRCRAPVKVSVDHRSGQISSVAAVTDVTQGSVRCFSRQNHAYLGASCSLSKALRAQQSTVHRQATLECGGKTTNHSIAHTYSWD